MKIKIYSVIEKESRAHLKYWNVKFSVEGMIDKVSFNLDINKTNYDFLNALYLKGDIELTQLPEVTSAGVYEGHEYRLRVMDRANIKALGKLVGYEPVLTSSLEAFFSGFKGVTPEKIVDGEMVAPTQEIE